MIWLKIQWYVAYYTIWHVWSGYTERLQECHCCKRARFWAAATYYYALFCFVFWLTGR